MARKQGETKTQTEKIVKALISGSVFFVISLILFYFNPIFAVIGLFITPILCQTIQNYRGAVLVGKSK